MREIALVSTCHHLGYAQYGRRMITTFDRHWPKDVPLFFYAEDFQPDVLSERIVALDLLASCPDLVAFKDRHRNNRSAHGQEARGTRVVVRWRKDKEGRRVLPKIKLTRLLQGIGYRWNAVRFSHKCFAIFDAAVRCEADVLFWLDADVAIFNDIPRAFLESLVPPDCLLSFLKRPTCSECGLVGYNLRHPGIGQFLADFEALYTEDRLFKEKEYHDSWLFDVLRKKYERKGCKTFDIGEGVGARTGHVFVNSSLGQYMDHMKGGRWVNGSSNADDFITPRDELYWRLAPRQAEREDLSADAQPSVAPSMQR